LSFLLLGDAKKGGNSVASMLWKLFDVKGLLNGITSNEINLVFDNCAGQNKNRMVYRMLFFMVKLGICRTARAIFLVKGHTKNDCDRMFNLMKYDYRKVNCFSPLELIDIVNKHPQVNALPMATSEFKDWNELEDTMIDVLPSIKKNHCFTVRATDSNSIMVQECAGAPVRRVVLVKKEFQQRDWRPLFILKELVPPGLPDIKWNELYSKWGRFVPEDKKGQLKYYVEKPPASLKKAIAEQSAQAKAARAKRTRGGGGDNGARESSSKPPARKRGRPKKI
jgi:hypothetical protein